MYKVGLAALAVLISGCTVTGSDPVMAVGMPNPASVYCIERLGTLDIHERADGNVTMCVLPDGSQVEEWELYRRNHPKK